MRNTSLGARLCCKCVGRIAILLLLLTLAACRSPYSSPEAMVKYQQPKARQLARTFPVGESREQVQAKFAQAAGLEFCGTVDLPPREPIQIANTGFSFKVEKGLPHPYNAARLMSPREPRRVDVFESLGSYGWGAAGIYVFYDDQDRVLVSLWEHWE